MNGKLKVETKEKNAYETEDLFHGLGVIRFFYVWRQRYIFLLRYAKKEKKMYTFAIEKEV